MNVLLEEVGHTLMRLPKGITGFYDSRKDVAPSLVDPSEFKSACFHAARLADATVTHFQSSTEKYPCSYHTAVVRLKHADESFDVLCNAYYPMLAFVDPNKSEWGRLCFVAAPAVAAFFRQATSFSPISIDYLQMYPASEMLTDLNEAERSQVHYWKPQQIGDIIFNDWD